MQPFCTINHSVIVKFFIRVQDYKQTRRAKPKPEKVDNPISHWQRHSVRYTLVLFIVALGFVLHLNSRAIYKRSLQKHPVEAPWQQKKRYLSHSFFHDAKKLGLNSRQAQQFVKLFPDINFTHLQKHDQIIVLYNQFRHLAAVALYTGKKRRLAIYYQQHFYLPNQFSGNRTDQRYFMTRLTKARSYLPPTI